MASVSLRENASLLCPRIPRHWLKRIHYLQNFSSVLTHNVFQGASAAVQTQHHAGNRKWTQPFCKAGKCQDVHNGCSVLFLTNSITFSDWSETTTRHFNALVCSLEDRTLYDQELPSSLRHQTPRALLGFAYGEHHCRKVFRGIKLLIDSPALACPPLLIRLIIILQWVTHVL